VNCGAFLVRVELLGGKRLWMSERSSGLLRDNVFRAQQTRNLATLNKDSLGQGIKLPGRGADVIFFLQRGRPFYDRTLMKNAISLLLVVFSLQLAKAAQPSDESLNKMMAVMHLEKMLDQMVTQINNGMKTGMDQGIQQSLHGQELNSGQKAAVEKFKDQLAAMMREELSMNKLKDVYLQAYRETFTQQEVDSITAFYSTPAGQAVVEKIPVAMQKAATLTQSRMGPMIQKMQSMQVDFIKDLSNAK